MYGFLNCSVNFISPSSSVFNLSTIFHAFARSWLYFSLLNGNISGKILNQLKFEIPKHSLNSIIILESSLTTYNNKSSRIFHVSFY